MPTKAELLKLIDEKKAVLDSFSPKPTDGQPNYADYQKARIELNTAKVKLADFVATQEEVSEVKPELSGHIAPGGLDLQLYMQTQLLVSHISSIGKFQGSSNNEVTNFLSKVTAIVDSCSSIKFSDILNSLKPCFSTSVLKTINNEGADIRTFPDFKRFIRDRYAASENIHQKMDGWFSTTKKR